VLDVAAARATSGAQRYDRDGRLAAAGQVRPDLLHRLLGHPYFRETPPASTGRETFSAAYPDGELDALPVVEPADLVATLTELTAVTVADALRPHSVRLQPRLDGCDSGQR
jgi:anhydro-N-acetylmuramic acid kinase